VVMQRRIFHIDMDAFFASVELLRYPQLKGLPVVIGGHIDYPENWPENEEDLKHIPVEAFPRLRTYFGRGVVSTCTYAARQKGIRSAMGMMRATVLCPDAIMLSVDFDKYREYSRRFKTAIGRITPIIENRGIDEIFVDATDHPLPTKELAELLKQAVWDETALTCSIGCADNKMLAKMASELNKPNGIYIWNLKDRTEKLWTMSCREIPGIGPKSQERLSEKGIVTIGDLAALMDEKMNEMFGPRTAAWLRQASMGLDASPIVTESEPVSFSKETTMERDMDPVWDKENLTPIFTRLCIGVAMELKEKHYTARGVSIKLRYKDFTQVTRDMMLDAPTQDAAVIRKAAGQALKRAPLDKKIRLMGVKVYHLERETPPEEGVKEEPALSEKNPALLRSDLSEVP
jgi:DNA polymerase-4